MAHLDITRENFDELLVNIGKPVLLDFWAPWCGPCMQLSPIVEEIGAERDDIIVGKVNLDEDEELAQRYRVMSIPTLIVLVGGKVVGKAVGFRNKQEILDLLPKK